MLNLTMEIFTSVKDVTSMRTNETVILGYSLPAGYKRYEARPDFRELLKNEVISDKNNAYGQLLLLLILQRSLIKLIYS